MGWDGGGEGSSPGGDFDVALVCEALRWQRAGDGGPFGDGGDDLAGADDAAVGEGDGGGAVGLGDDGDAVVEEHADAFFFNDGEGAFFELEREGLVGEELVARVDEDDVFRRVVVLDLGGDFDADGACGWW